MVLIITMKINLILCLFNLLPLFPLDGHHIARELLPPEKQADFMAWQRQFGIICLLLLVLGPRVIGSITKKQLPSLMLVYDYAGDLMIRIFL
jgi:Zn-dependent protease